MPAAGTTAANGHRRVLVFDATRAAIAEQTRSVGGVKQQSERLLRIDHLARDRKVLIERKMEPSQRLDSVL